nr:actin, other eukaryote [Ipomoea batatas]
MFIFLIKVLNLLRVISAGEKVIRKWRKVRISSLSFVCAMAWIFAGDDAQGAVFPIRILSGIASSRNLTGTVTVAMGQKEAYVGIVFLDSGDGVPRHTVSIYEVCPSTCNPASGYWQDTARTTSKTSLALCSERAMSCLMDSEITIGNEAFSLLQRKDFYGTLSCSGGTNYVGGIASDRMKQGDDGLWLQVSMKD